MLLTIEPLSEQVLSAESSLIFLVKRYGVDRNTIRLWRQFLGYDTSLRHQHYYSPEEIVNLDYFFAGGFAPRDRRPHWGMRMGQIKYGELILDKGLTFPEYLQNTYKITYEQFLEKRRRLWQRELFAN